jgi:hypothetical protein
LRVPESRSKAPASRREFSESAAPSSGWRAWFDPLRPDLSRRGIARLAARATAVGLTITVMSALADWSARGFLDRGGLDRLVSMKPPAAPETRTALKPDRALDRARLKALAGAEKPR